MTKLLLLLGLTLISAATMSAVDENAAERLIDPDGVASILLLDEWHEADEEDHVFPGKFPDLVSSPEIITNDRSRVILMVFKRGEKTKEMMTKTVLSAIANKSDAFAIRSSMRAKVDGLDAVILQSVHSKGKTLLESYVSVMQDDDYIYALHGMCLVRVGEKRCDEILSMMSSFRREAGRQNEVVNQGNDQQFVADNK